MWLFLGIICLSVLAWFYLGQRVNLPIKVNYQLALISLSVLAVVFYLLMVQEPIDLLLDTGKSHDEKRTVYARVGPKETEFQIIFKQGMLGYNTSR